MIADKSKDQHFMVDSELLEFISDFARGKIVLEIGGGAGNLTRWLVRKARKVYVIEKDPRFGEELRKTGAEVIIGDALKVKWPEAEVLISNLPYHICEPIVTKLLRDGPSKIIATFPKKLFDKFGRTKVGIFYGEMFDAELLREVPKEAFEPKPRVKSVLLRLERREPLTPLSKIIMQYDKKAKNALVEFLCAQGSTKNDARGVIESMKLPSRLAEKKVLEMTNSEFLGLMKKIETAAKNQ